MKKSFMTRALATGLSLAMAFSLSAATNVTTAAALTVKEAAMRSSKITLEVGQTKNYRATAATQKAANLKISNVKISNAAKAELSVKRYAKKKYIAVTGIAPTASTRNVVVTFKNTKTKKTSTVTMKATVKGEDKPVEELAMTAEATGVKKITVKFNQAVDTATAITVAKGSAATTLAQTNAIVWNTDATEATLTTAGKLTEGTYTVTAKVAEDKTLTADVVVAKNETLTEFKLVGETLKATSATETTSGSIKYQALNQYGEPMSCSNATVTVAPGKVNGGNTPTATKDGEAKVEGIPEMYATPYSNYEFSVVIVDTATGVHFEGKVKYGACAKAASLETVGLYSKSKGKIQDMTAGDTVEDYIALFKVKDQYGDPYDVKAKDVSKEANGGNNPDLTVSAISGLTNVAAKEFENADPVQTVDEVEYFAIPLKHLDTSASPKKTAVAGDFSLMIVNSTIGPVGTPSFTVSDSVVISSIDISADAIYAGQKNTMNYTITDTKGNTVTAYNDLKNMVFNSKDGKGSLQGTMAFEKQLDGTAKLVYTPVKFDNDLKSNIEVFTVTANEVTSSNYTVKTFSFTVLAQRKAQAVVGVASTVPTTKSTTGGAVTINLKDLLIEDQYGNLFTSDELKDVNGLVSGASIYVTGPSAVSSGAWAVSPAAAAGVTGASFSAGSVQLMAPTTDVEVTTSFNVNVNGKTSEGYTLKMSKIKSSDLPKVTSLKIENVNKGYPVYVTDGALRVSLVETPTLISDGTAIPVVVSGQVNGKKVYMSSAQCDTKVTYTKPGAYSSTNVKNEKATIEVVVSTADGAVTLTQEIDISNVPAALKTIKKDANYAVVATKGASTGATVTTKEVSSLAKGFTAEDQYGQTVTDLDSDVKYSASLKSAVNDSGTPITLLETDYEIIPNNLSSTAITIKKVDGKCKVTFTIVASFGDQKVEYDVELWNYKS